MTCDLNMFHHRQYFVFCCKFVFDCLIEDYVTSDGSRRLIGANAFCWGNSRCTLYQRNFELKFSLLVILHCYRYQSKKKQENHPNISGTTFNLHFFSISSSRNLPITQTAFERYKAILVLCFKCWLDLFSQVLS